MLWHAAMVAARSAAPFPPRSRFCSHWGRLVASHAFAFHIALCVEVFPPPSAVTHHTVGVMERAFPEPGVLADAELPMALEVV
jgi:hypothetical protein